MCFTKYIYDVYIQGDIHIILDLYIEFFMQGGIQRSILVYSIITTAFTIHYIGISYSNIFRYIEINKTIFFINYLVNKKYKNNILINII
jgi:hypothetical protein